MTDTENTLDLTDLAPERREVRLPNGGRKVEMLDPRELSFKARAQLMTRIQLMIRTGQKVNDGAEDEQSIADWEDATRKLTALVLPDATGAEIAGLSALHMDQVTGSFLVRYGDMMKLVAKTMGPEMEKVLTSVS